MVDDNRLTWSIFVAVLFTAVYLETTLPATASTSDFSFVSSIDLMPEVATPSIDNPIQKNSINQASSIKTSKPKVTAPSIDPIPKKTIIIPLSLSIVYPKSNSIASKSIFQFRESYPVQSFIPTRLLQIDTQIITLPKPKRHLQKSHIVQIALDGIQIGECTQNDAWLACTGGCNDLIVGKGCSNCKAEKQKVKIEVVCKEGKQTYV